MRKIIFAISVSLGLLAAPTPAAESQILGLLAKAAEDRRDPVLSFHEGLRAAGIKTEWVQSTGESWVRSDLPSGWLAIPKESGAWLIPVPWLPPASLQKAYSGFDPKGMAFSSVEKLASLKADGPVWRLAELGRFTAISRPPIEHGENPPVVAAPSPSMEWMPWVLLGSILGAVFLNITTAFLLLRRKSSDEKNLDPLKQELVSALNRIKDDPQETPQSPRVGLGLEQRLENRLSDHFGIVNRLLSHQTSTIRELLKYGIREQDVNDSGMEPNSQRVPTDLPIEPQTYQVQHEGVIPSEDLVLQIHRDCTGGDAGKNFWSALRQAGMSPVWVAPQASDSALSRSAPKWNESEGSTNALVIPFGESNQGWLLPVPATHLVDILQPAFGVDWESFVPAGKLAKPAIVMRVAKVWELVTQGKLRN